MDEHEGRLRSALEYVGAGTQAESRLDMFAVLQRRRRPALLAATAGFLLVLGDRIHCERSARKARANPLGSVVVLECGA